MSVPLLNPLKLGGLKVDCGVTITVADVRLRLCKLSSTCADLSIPMPLWLILNCWMRTKLKLRSTCVNFVCPSMCVSRFSLPTEAFALPNLIPNSFSIFSNLNQHAIDYHNNMASLTASNIHPAFINRRCFEESWRELGAIVCYHSLVNPARHT